MTLEDYLAKATRAVASARLLFDDGDLEGACNRAYYAMFNAAHAALIWSDAMTDPAAVKTHNGLMTAFGQYLIRPGHLSVELGKSLNRVERIRLLADYTGEVSAEKAVMAIEQAVLFVETVQQMVMPQNPP